MGIQSKCVLTPILLFLIVTIGRKQAFQRQHDPSWLRCNMPARSVYQQQQQMGWIQNSATPSFAHSIINNNCDLSLDTQQSCERKRWSETWWILKEFESRSLFDTQETKLWLTRIRIWYLILNYLAHCRCTILKHMIVRWCEQLEMWGHERVGRIYPNKRCGWYLILNNTVKGACGSVWGRDWYSRNHQRRNQYSILFFQGQRWSEMRSAALQRANALTLVKCIKRGYFAWK